MLQTIERFKKFKQTCESAFLQSVKVLEVQIEILEKQLTGNSKLAEVVLSDVKIVFEAAIFKLQSVPELETPQLIPVPVQ